MTKGKWAIVLYEACRLVAVVVLVAVVGAVYLAGKAKATAPKVVRAQAFELVDAKGKTRAELSVLAEGSPGLWLYDAKGGLRAALAVAPDGPAVLWLYDAKRKGCAMLSATADGGPKLSLFDGKQRTRAMLSVAADGRPALELSDEQGKTRAALGATALETTRTGALEKRAESSLVLFDKEGKVVWQAP